MQMKAYLFMGSSSSKADMSSNRPDVESPGFKEKNSYNVIDIKMKLEEKKNGNWMGGNWDMEMQRRNREWSTVE